MHAEKHHEYVLLDKNRNCKKADEIWKDFPVKKLKVIFRSIDGR